MKLTKFDRLTKRDFENGAVIDEIRAAIKQRDALWVALNDLVDSIADLKDAMSEDSQASAWVYDYTGPAMALAHDALDAAGDERREG